MKKDALNNLFWGILSVSFAVFLFSPSVSISKVCVLSLFETSGPQKFFFSSKVSEVFRYYSDADLFEKPSVEQIKYCFASGKYEEIVWASHGSAINHDPTASYSCPILVEEEEGQVRKTALPIRFFQRLAEITDTSRLKTFRVELCGASNSSMTGFIHFLNAKGVVIDTSPTSQGLSKLAGESVTSLSTEWLARSIDRNRVDVWKTNGNRYCDRDWYTGCDRHEAVYILPLKSR